MCSFYSAHYLQENINCIEKHHYMFRKESGSGCACTKNIYIYIYSFLLLFLPKYIFDKRKHLFYFLCASIDYHNKCSISWNLKRNHQEAMFTQKILLKPAGVCTNPMFNLHSSSSSRLLVFIFKLQIKHVFEYVFFLYITGEQIIFKEETNNQMFLNILRYRSNILHFWIYLAALSYWGEDGIMKLS